MLRTKWILPIIIFILLQMPQAVFAVGDEQGTPVTDQLVRSQLNELQTEEVESFWKLLQTEYGRYFNGRNAPGLFDLLLSGNKELETKDVLTALLRYFFHEVLYNGKLLGTIIVLTVFSMILQTLQTAFENNQVSRVAYSIVFMVIIILAVDSFSVAVDAAKTAIERMIDFMLALIPLLLTLLATMGNLGSVTLFHPLIIFMIHIIGTFIYTIVFPLLFFATILSVVSTLSEKYKVNQLAGLMRKVSVGILGGLLTIFLGVISVQGATTAVTDGVTIRTAKYITGNFIPVIGGTISEAADTVVGASLLVKNTVGLAGVIILLMVCSFPALKILSLAFIYNFSAAIMQPLGNSPIIESLSTIGRTLIYIFAALATVGLMFFLAITIIVASGNISVMMR
ncbi:stage III sporulation protein AE [Paenactinomyces guangxiensis]|uniref:Stage III sporulation protein AE n=1 Tax=Paenactinomyces guangxiensis TaxID=1490290 RepID=A0A7W2A9B2_9BACL|nr:stage III sporulation protein AE [Paenactinomyces guangxiensis]MBA4494987.1 stage III sporulation protein AE [Paenactinomyces guangxiensis]MBH8592070.1 stage III sporulation protein AE [Paenactinomyces guangxiensis]